MCIFIAISRTVFVQYDKLRLIEQDSITSGKNGCTVIFVVVLLVSEFGVSFGDGKESSV